MGLRTDTPSTTSDTSSTTAAAPATSTAPATTTAPAPSAAPAVDAAVGATTDAGAATTTDAPPPWEPNFKFKTAKIDGKKDAFGRIEQDEHEFDEWIRDAIKDPDTEKKARELYERSKGIDYVKHGRQQIQTELNQLKQQRAQEMRGFGELGNMLKAEKFGDFFDTMKIPRAAVFKWCLQEAEYNQLPPEQKAQIDANRAAEKRAEVSSSRAETLEERYVEQANHIRRVELNVALAKPEVSAFASRFDAQVGQPGAFQNEIVAVGAQVWATQERDISVDEAVTHVMGKYGKFLGAADAASGAPALDSAGKPVVATTAPRDLPVIPRIQGGSTSPTKAPVKSFDELKKLSREAEGRLARATV